MMGQKNSRARNYENFLLVQGTSSPKIYLSNSVVRKRRRRRCWAGCQGYLGRLLVPEIRHVLSQAPTAGPDNPDNRPSTAAAASYGQHCWTSRSLGYLSPGQAENFRNFEPCYSFVPSCQQGLKN